jgi:hypothetical protein
VDRIHQPQHQPSPRTPGDVYVAAAQTHHRAHCTTCRDRHEAAEAGYAEAGASIERRDRLTLGLRTARNSAAVNR